MCIYYRTAMPPIFKYNILRLNLKIMFNDGGIDAMDSVARAKKGVNLEVGGGGPDVAVVAADDRVLDHLGAQELVVHIALPTHRCWRNCLFFKPICESKKKDLGAESQFG
jgi:hypothetical protein